MPWRRRRVVEVEEQPVAVARRAPNPWPWLLLLLVLVGFGLAGLWLYLDDRSDKGTKTVVVETVAPSRVAVPDVLRQSQVDAGNAVEAAGLRADTYPVESDEPRGTVVAESPAAGQEVDAPSTVRLNVSLGSGERAAKAVPDVTGPPESEARSQARASGFTVRTVDRPAPEPDNRGEVLTQQPAAGTSAPELTQITLYVGR